VKHLCLLTAKPLIYAANVAEDDLADPTGNGHVAAVRQVAQAQGAEVVVVSAQVPATNLRDGCSGTRAPTAEMGARGTP